MRAKAALPTLALACLLALPGCGGGSDSATGTSTATAANPKTSTATAKPKQSTEGKPPRPAKEESPSKEAKPSAFTDPEPLPNQGTSALAPGVPIAKGGDNSIQRYGTEAESSERIAATQLLGAYFAALAAEEWGSACQKLSGFLQSKFAELAKSARGGGCAAGLGLLLSKVPPSTLPSGKNEVLSYRAQGPQAFLIYRDTTGKAFNMPLRREGGRWGINALLGIELVL